MRRYWQCSALLAAMLALPAAAQTSGGSPSGAGAGSNGAGDTSPGEGVRGESETGVDTPSTAPVDNRTLKPIQRPESAAGPVDYGTGAGASDAAESMETHLGHKAPSSRIRKGLAEIHAANQAEIQASKLAEQSASSPEVKSFAQQMVDDHTKNDEALVAIAGPRVDLRSGSYRAQQKEAAASMKDLEGKTGSSFDQAYMAQMVSDHRKLSGDVKALAERAQSEGRTDWAKYLDQTAQVIQSHLSHAERIRSQNTASSNSDASTGSSTDAGNSSQ